MVNKAIQRGMLTHSVGAFSQGNFYSKDSLTERRYPWPAPIVENDEEAWTLAPTRNDDVDRQPRRIVQSSHRTTAREGCYTDKADPVHAEFEFTSSPSV